MSYFVNRLFGLAFVLVLAPTFPGSSVAQTAPGGGCPQRIATWEFFADSSLTTSGQQNFKDHFCAQISKFETWGAGATWAAPPGAPRLKIFVGKHYNGGPARSLVPSWEGDRGRIEIPEQRAMTNTADIAHEVFHVYYPNGNRMIAEGMAVYVQDETGLNKAYPNEGVPVDTLLKCKASAFLDKVHLKTLDDTITPDGITLELAEIPRPSLRPAWAYVVAGSFVRYLIKTYGMDKFHDLYHRTEFEPGRRMKRTNDDWSELYGQKLDNLETAWKAAILGSSVNCPASTPFDVANGP